MNYTFINGVIHKAIIKPHLIALLCYQQKQCICCIASGYLLRYLMYEIKEHGLILENHYLSALGHIRKTTKGDDIVVLTKMELYNIDQERIFYNEREKEEWRIYK